MPKKSQPGDLAYDPMTYMGGRRRGKTGPETSSNGTRGRGDVTSTEWEVADKVMRQKRGRSEDSPNWKWWKQGNQTAGRKYAVKNPPPKEWTVTRGPRKTVQAGEPQPGSVGYSDNKGYVKPLSGTRAQRSQQVRRQTRKGVR